MKKQNTSVQTDKELKFYTLLPKNGSFALACITIDDRAKVTEITEHPEEVFAIAMAQLTSNLRRDLGL